MKSAGSNLINKIALAVLISILKGVSNGLAKKLARGID